MRQSPLQQRQNSHPNLVHQHSYSSSSSSLADRSSLESPSKLTTCSLSYTDPYLTENAPNSDSDLEAEADPPDWRHSLSEEELKNLSAKELKRQDVINELFHTEKSHVRNLKVLDSVFRQPLLDKGRMSKELSSRLFANLQEVLNLHQKYNVAMKHRAKAGFPIGDIGDILTDMFLDGNSDNFVSVCGRFIKKQNMTIEELKRVRGRDAKLELFLSELERKPACRRLQLQSMLPMEHQRLVKYPLLLEQIAKYSNTPEHQQEYEVVVAAMEKSKEILDSIDQLVADEQNKERLNEIQLNLDTSGLDKMGTDHPICKEYKNLDLTKHVLKYDGVLNLKLGDTKRVKQLHVFLLEDCMMLLQKQGDKYLLKFHNNQSQAGNSDSRRAFHPPIIKYSTMLIRANATDKRAFYLLNTTELGPQIYELLANSTSERAKWIKYITEVSTAHRCRDGMPPKNKSEPEELGSLTDKKDSKQDLRSQSFRDPNAGSPRLTRADRQNSSPPECPITPPDSGGGGAEAKPDPASSDSGASTPSAPKKRLQRVEILKIVDSEPMIEPSQVRVNEAKVLVADPVVTPFEKLRQKDEEVNRILDEKQKLIAQILQVPEEDFDVISDIAATSNHKREVREVLLAALAQARSLTQVVSASLKVTEEDLVSRSSPSRDVHPSLNSTSDQLVQITASMNHHLTDLLAIMKEREDERDLLKRELSKYQDQVRGYLRSPLPPSSRPHSFISIESDPMDLESDPRPHSLISLESDTHDCPPTEDEDDVMLSPPEEDVDHQPPDSDLTPTEERVTNSELSSINPTIEDPNRTSFDGKLWDLTEKVSLETDQLGRDCARESLKEMKKEWTPDQDETSP